MENDYVTFFQKLNEVENLLIYNLTSPKTFGSVYVQYNFANSKVERLNYKDVTYPVNKNDINDIFKGFDNGTITNPEWPSELQVLDNRGSHDNGLFNHNHYENVPEWLLYIGIGNQKPYLGWFNNSLLMMYVNGTSIIAFKVKENADKINMQKICDTHPFKSALYAEMGNKDANVLLKIKINYQENENVVHEIKLDNITVDDITQLNWVNYANYISFGT